MSTSARGALALLGVLRLGAIGLIVPAINAEGALSIRWMAGGNTYQRGYHQPFTEYRTLAVSPDGDLAAAGSTDHLVKLWDTSNGQLKATLSALDGAVSTLEFSPDGSLLAAGTDELHGLDRPLRVWRVPDFRPLFSGATGAVSSVAFSPDGATLLSGGDELVLWDAQTGERVRTFPAPARRIQSVAFAPDGSVFATADSQTVRVLDPNTGDTRHVFTTAPAALVAFSADGLLLATGASRSIVVYDAQTYERISSITPGTDVSTFRFSGQDGMLWTSGLYNSRAYRWNPLTGASLGAIIGLAPQSLSQIAFADNGSVLLGLDQFGPLSSTTQFLQSPLVRIPIQSSSGDIALSSDGQFISGYSIGEVRVWGTGDGVEIFAKAQNFLFAGEMEFSPDGSLLAVAGAERLTDEYRLHIFAVPSGAELVNVVLPPSNPRFAFSADGAHLGVLNTRDATVEIWDVATGAIVESVPSGDDDSAIDFTPDGTLLLAAGYAGEGAPGHLRLWRTSDWTAAGEVVDPINMMLAIDSSAGGQLIATASYGEIRIRHYPDLGFVRSFPTLPGYPRGLFLSNDGSVATLMASDGSVHIFDVASGEETKSFLQGALEGRSAYSADGRFVALKESASISIWDAHAGAQRRELVSQALAAPIVWSPDGSIVGGESTGLRDAATGENLSYFPLLDLSPDGQFAAVAAGYGVELVDALSTEDIATIAEHHTYALGARFHPSGTMLASGAYDRRLRITDVATGNRLWTRSEEFSDHFPAAYSHDGATLATGTWFGEVRLSNSLTGEIVWNVSGHDGSVQAVAFSPNDRLLASASGWTPGRPETGVKLWDSATGTLSGRSMSRGA